MKTQEIGLVKDILWYLKAAIELKAIYELKDVHLLALSEIIDEAEKTKGR